MKWPILIAALLAAAAVGVWFSLPKNLELPAATGRPFSYTPFAEVLSAVVDSVGRVNYPALQQHPDSLLAFIALLRAYSPEATPDQFPDETRRLAYWINAYNAFTLFGVLKKYPLASVRDALPLRGFFWLQQFNAGGRRMNLYTLENSILRKRFREPRIHFAINCASRSCPPLKNEPYMPDRLEQQLDSATRAFIQQPTAVTIDSSKGVVGLSRIFQWYTGDFLQSGLEEERQLSPPILKYIRHYATPVGRKLLDARANWSIQYFEYDWGLNSQ